MSCSLHQAVLTVNERIKYTSSALIYEESGLNYCRKFLWPPNARMSNRENEKETERRSVYIPSASLYSKAPPPSKIMEIKCKLAIFENNINIFIVLLKNLVCAKQTMSLLLCLS
jgi:hypothetical protein